jgi:hypothetical protein
MKTHSSPYRGKRERHRYFSYEVLPLDSESGERAILFICGITFVTAFVTL